MSIMTENGLELLKTKEQLAYDLLREIILKGDLPKNQFLSQRMLAERVNTNLSTIRTVLRQLENDHLIENIPRWGVKIPIETEAVLRDRYFIRELLEVGAIKLIIKNRDSPEFNAGKIMALAEQCDAILRKSSKDIDKFAKIHFDFHIEIAKQCGSPLLLESLSRIHFQGLILQNAIRAWGYGATSNHVVLADAILHKDEETCINIIIQHIQNGLKNELKTLKAEENEIVARRTL
jgi:DNA-binding GntR family transcriptional regulator